MAAQVLGRTNQAFPPVWLRLVTPLILTDNWAEQLVRAAVAANTVIDISSGPALWGGHMRGTDALLMSRSDFDIERATDEKHASDLVQAHLIETLSAIGRERLDFYFLRIRRALEEYQISGALRAIEMARQEGHIRWVGIESAGPALATLGVWQFNNAFEVVLAPEDQEDKLTPMAQQRRVGIVLSSRGTRDLEGAEVPTQPQPRSLLRRDDRTVLVNVASESEIGSDVAVA